jgi:hexosaminidase
LQQEGSWIYAPQSAEVWISNVGTDFTSAGKTSTFSSTQNTNGIMKIGLNNVRGRYIRVLVKNNGTIAEGKPGAGNNAWLFVDEIEIN